MLRVQEDERSRIAADLHDDTIQVMTAALISLGVVNRHVQGVGDERKQRAIDGARDTLAEAIERTRRMTFDLRPQLLDADGVGAAITSLAKAVATEAGFAISIDVSAERYAPVIESLVYRTVREVLTNTRKHAHAAHVHVGLREHDGALHGTITDDGRGFDVETALERARQTFHVGFDIIAERVRLAGGAFEIFSAPGRGTDVRFSVPVVREARPPA
jgi:signal transduction histidine kinase